MFGACILQSKRIQEEPGAGSQESNACAQRRGPWDQSQDRLRVAPLTPLPGKASWCGA